MMNSKDFYRANAIFIGCLTALFAAIRYTFFKQYSFKQYSTPEICTWLAFPFFILIGSLLFSNILLIISNSAENPSVRSNAKDESNFKIAIWKNLFVFTLANTLVFLFAPLVFYVLHGMDPIIIEQDIHSFNGFDYLIICVVAGYSFGFLYSILTKRKISHPLLVALLAVSGFLMTMGVVINTSVYKEQPEATLVVEEEEYQDYDEGNRIRSVGEMSYEEEQEIKHQDSINALKYYFDFQDVDYIKCGAYFADLWESPFKDKDSTQNAIINYLQNNLNLRKHSKIYHFLDNSNDLKLTGQTTKVLEKIGRDPAKLLRAFKSYKELVYHMIPDQIYHESGLRNLTQLLLKTHDELYVDKSKLEEIYNIMTMPEDDIHYGRGSYFEDLKDYVSSEVIDNCGEVDAVWLYSFWARRYNEKNDDAVFEILSEINRHYH